MAASSRSGRRAVLTAAELRAVATLRRLPPRARQALYRLIGEFGRVNGVGSAPAIPSAR